MIPEHKKALGKVMEDISKLSQEEFMLKLEEHSDNMFSRLGMHFQFSEEFLNFIIKEKENDNET